MAFLAALAQRHPSGDCPTNTWPLHITKPDAKSCSEDGMGALGRAGRQGSPAGGDAA